MKKINVYIVITSLFCVTSFSQNLFTETFDTYPIGDCSNGFNLNTPGIGGWYFKKHSLIYNDITVEIQPEPTRGNVIVVSCENEMPRTPHDFDDPEDAITFTQKNIDVLWQQRAANNNVMHIQYDVNFTYYPKRMTNAFILRSFNPEIQNVNFKMTTHNFNNNDVYPFPQINLHAVVQTSDGYNIGDAESLDLPNNNYVSNNYLYNKWITVHFYIEYKYNVEGDFIGGTTYVYMPDMYIAKYADFDNTLTKLPTELFFHANTVKGGTKDFAKFDNIQLNAINAVPQHVLNATKFSQMVFNVAPNPATNFVTINSTENALIQQIQVYDNAGKLVGTYTYNNQDRVQLNTENLATGVYMLQIQTNTGKGYSKLIKK